jgi:N-acetylneuraminic acid mutarotase
MPGLVQSFISRVFQVPTSKPIGRKFRFLEELESRLAPASYVVDASLQIRQLDGLSAAESQSHAVVFFESSVNDYQVLRQGLNRGTDAVVLDSAGDGLREIATFLAGRHDLTSIGVVAHGATGAVFLGTATLDVETLGSYGPELAIVASALGSSGELDLWSCNVAAGQEGETLVRSLAIATGSGVAAADHVVGSAAHGGNWQLDVRTAGATGQVPFSATSLSAFDEVLGAWGLAAYPLTARYGQTATLLGNGTVLFAGGNDAGASPVSSAEIYDPVANTWRSAGFMVTPRYEHTATLLPNGKVLVVGGAELATGGSVSSAELYDPVHNVWSSAGSMATPRYGQTATLLPNGKVLVAGGLGDTSVGSGGYLSSAELYDPVSNTWSSASSMATTRQHHTATLLPDGTVLVAGGFNNNPSGALSSAELYNPISNTWSSAGSMATLRDGHTATLLNNGKVLVTGGAVPSAVPSAELYDPVANTWSSAGSMATARQYFTATLLSNGMVLVTGGYNSQTPQTYLSSAELYDPVSNSWSPAGSMYAARIHQTATLLGNGNVLVVGGVGGLSGFAVGVAELYYPNGTSAVYFKVIAPVSATTGSPINVTVTALDLLSNIATAYAGTVHFTSSDGSAALPSDATLTNGVGVFTVTWSVETLNPVCSCTI